MILFLLLRNPNWQSVHRYSANNFFLTVYVILVCNWNILICLPCSCIYLKRWDLSKFLGYSKKIGKNMGIPRQTASMVVYKIMVIILLPSLTARQWVGPQTKWLFPPQSVSDSWRLNYIVCGWAHRGLVCGFLVFRLQIANGPLALFHHSVCDMCFTVMFHREFVIGSALELRMMFRAS